MSKGRLTIAPGARPVAEPQAAPAPGPA